MRTTPRVFVFASAALAMGLAAAPASAQDTEDKYPELEDKIGELEKTIRELKKRVDEAEKDEDKDKKPETRPKGDDDDGEEGDEDDPTKAQVLWKWLTENFHASITLNNFYVGGNHSVVGNAATFEHSYNTFTVAQFELDIWTEFKHGVDFRVDIDTTEDDAGFGGTGTLNFPDDLQVEQGYIQIDFDKLLGGVPLEFVFGRFNAPIGFEPIDAPGLWQFSRSNVAVNLTPSNFTGALLKFKSDIVDVEAYVANDVDVNDDRDGEKIGGGRITLKLMEQTGEDGGKYHMIQVVPAFFAGHLTGLNHSGDAGLVADLVVIAQPIEMIKVAFEYNFTGLSRPIALPGGPTKRHGRSNGYQLSVRAQLLKWLGVLVRGDYIQDEDGFATQSSPGGLSGAFFTNGRHHRLYSATTALLFRIPLGNDIVKELFVNLEWRYDHSNFRIFTKRAPSTVGDTKWRSQFAFQMFFYF